MERFWLLFRSRHKAWNGYLNAAPPQGRTRSRIQPAIPLSPRSPPLFSAVVLYIFIIFLFLAQCDVKSEGHWIQWLSYTECGWNCFSTCTLPRTPPTLLQALLEGASSSGGRGKESGLAGNAPLPMDVKAMAALPNSPILIFKRDPANAWCLDHWQWYSCSLGWLLEGKP